MKLIKYFIIFNALHFSTHITAQEYNKFKGTAKNEEGEVVYYEDHQIEHNDQGQVKRILTRYLRPNENKDIFARLESKFNKSDFVPESLFKDFRNEHIEKTDLDLKKNHLIIEHSNASNDERSQEVLKLTEQMVMGQGYHNYIVANFEDFKVNEKRTLDFVVPAKQDFYKFDLTYLGKTKTNSDFVTFRLDITSWILRLFASKIEVDYEPKTKRLMAYRGLTNIENDDGHSQSLNITYEYPKDKN